MRIILLTTKLNFKVAGGSVMDLHLKARGLVESGHDVSVVTVFSHQNFINQKLPYKVIEESSIGHGMIGIQYDAFRIIKKYASTCDVIYIDGHIFIYAGGLYRLLGGKAAVVAFFNVRLSCWRGAQGNPDTDDIPFLKKVKRFIRLVIEHRIGVLIANNVDAFIFNTPMVEQLYVRFGYDKTKSTIIEDFVDMRNISTMHKISKESIIKHQHADQIILFSSGRMIPEKGFDLIIKAFSLLKDKEHYRVIISGDGPDKERLQLLTSELGIDNYFSFPGWIEKDKLESLFLRANIFIFPKWWIEYGSALLTEALAYGLPCIIPGGGALEWLTEGNALTFKNNNVNELASRIEELGRNEKSRISLSMKSFERIDTLDCRVLSKKLARILEDAVQ